MKNIRIAREKKPPQRLFEAGREDEFELVEYPSMLERPDLNDTFLFESTSATKADDQDDEISIYLKMYYNYKDAQVLVSSSTFLGQYYAPLVMETPVDGEMMNLLSQPEPDHQKLSDAFADEMIDAFRRTIRSARKFVAEQSKGSLSTYVEPTVREMTRLFRQLYRSDPTTMPSAERAFSEFFGVPNRYGVANRIAKTQRGSSMFGI